MQSRPDQSVSIFGIVMDLFNIANLTPFPFVSVNKWSTISSFPLHTVIVRSLYKPLSYNTMIHQDFYLYSFLLQTKGKKNGEKRSLISLVGLFGVGDSSWAVHSSICLLRILLCSVHVSTRNNSWLLRSRMPGEVYPSQIYSGHYKRHPNLLQA